AGDTGQQGADFRLAVAAVAAERPDRGQLARLGPAGHGLGVHAEHGGDLGRGQQGLRLGRASRHVYGLSSWICVPILSLDPGTWPGCPIFARRPILASPEVIEQTLNATLFDERSQSRPSAASR